MQTFIRKFREEDEGSAAVETLLWVPLLTFLMVMIVDASFIFHGKSQTLQIVQNANRAFSVGNLVSTEQVVAQVTEDLKRFTDRPEVTAELIDDVLRTTVRVPGNDLMSVGSIPGLKNLRIGVMAQHYVEQ